MTKANDPKPDPANDNDARAAASAVTTGGALTSLQALGAALSNVDTSSVVGRSVTPMLQFKREGDGTWMYGQRKIVVEDNSRWAINPLTFKWGFICFNDNNKVLGERLVSVSQSKPDVAELPDKGFDWSEQWAVNLKCVDGTDAGVEVTYKPTTVGGIQAVATIIDAVRDRLAGAHDGKVVPIVHLEKDSYPHQQYGRVWTPTLTIVDWMPLDGPAPAPAPAPTPAAAAPPANSNQPRRRRVG
jgi:hypothetical protein